MHAAQAPVLSPYVAGGLLAAPRRGSVSRPVPVGAKYLGRSPRLLTTTSMRRGATTVSGDLTIEQLVDDYLMTTDERAFLVVDGTELRG